MASVQSSLDSLLGGTDESKEEADRVAMLDRLKADLTHFGTGVLEHLDREELYFAGPVARKVCQVEPLSYDVDHGWFLRATLTSRLTFEFREQEPATMTIST